jgi:curli biogenesis system outer membrane secretion channel CsgG
MMTKRVLVCAVLAVGCLAQIVLALPDLVVARLEISPAVPTDSTLVTITATIENAGRSDVHDAFFVRFNVDGREIDIAPLTSLDSGRTHGLTTTWTATAGPHVLSVEIDGPFSRVEEANELNNTRSMLVNVRLDDDAMAVLAPLKIAVARFDSASSTGFVNVGEGVADELIDRFAASGLRVLDRVELNAMMQANGLNPARPADVAAAAQLIGADLLVLGSVVAVGVQEASLNLGFLRVDSASVDVSLSAQVVDVYSSQALSSVSAEGHDEGTTGFSIDLGQLLSFLTTGTSEVCSGDLQADRAWYNSGQTVLLGHHNDGAPAWFGIEVYSSTGAFLKWLGWQFIDTDGCETWFWDQRDASGIPMSPGIYTAKLWDGTSYIDAAGFQIRPGISLSIPAADEITVGSQQFDETVVGTAMNRAIDRLTSALLLSLGNVVPQVLDRAALPAAAEMMVAPREGQIAAILPNGRIAINLGASSGVTEGDVFEVLEVENLVLDPQTNEILAYDIVSVKGEIVISEAREQVSYAVPTSSFVPIIGDIVRGAR